MSDRFRHASARRIVPWALLIGLASLSGCGSGDTPPEGKLPEGQHIVSPNADADAKTKQGQVIGKSIKNRGRRAAMPSP